uniref:Odorant binding protein n=1 Tax=Heliothis virescens TaxID=7102 RepID=A0A2A4K8S0_HELVI
MPKNDVTEEEVGDIEKGKFIESRNVMCYVACIYTMTQVVKNNKLSYEAMIKQVDMMFPAEMRDAVKAAATSCKDIEQVGKIEQGVFLEERNVMCYVACIYKSLQVVKNDKLDMALIAKQIEALYPPELKEPVKKAVSLCIHSQDDYNDLCEKVFHASKCLYEKDPASFIFP